MYMGERTYMITASSDLEFNPVIMLGDLDDVTAGKLARHSVVVTDHLLEVVAVADQQTAASERHRFTPYDSRPWSRLRPLVLRTQLLGVRLHTDMSLSGGSGQSRLASAR